MAATRSFLVWISVGLASCSSEGGGASSSAPGIEPEPKTSTSVTAATAEPSASATASATASGPAPEASSSAGIVAPRPTGREPGRLGCPCGCDRSTEMADELATETELGHGDGAKATLLETLRTIAEREDGGYITEAMAQHRERMLALAPSLFGEAMNGRGVAWKPDLRGLGAPMTNGALRVRVILSAHGEATEIVRGKEKPLRSSFRLGMEIQNLGGDAVIVGMPVIEGNVSMPIDRVYVLGSSGAQWQGAIGAHETIHVNAIGYIAEPVLPGTRVDASVTFESMELSTSARAAGHWMECAPGESL